MHGVTCAALLLSPVAGVRSGAAEFLGISALDLVLRQALKGSFEIQKKMRVVKHCEVFARTLKVLFFFPVFKRTVT